MKRKRICFLVAVLVIAILALVFKPYIRIAAAPVIRKFTKAKTIEQRLVQYGDTARARMRPYFDNAHVKYPPSQLTLLGLKNEKLLQLYATDVSGSWRLIRSYPVLAASGKPGPKLREGDKQVPEGIYPIESLNPNSTFHLSLRVGYPNEFDRKQAEIEGRANLGGDIMIHGSFVSTGCLAMGDEVAEDLFVLVADAGLQNVTVLISPIDFRVNKALPVGDFPNWTEALYSQIQSRLAELPLHDR